VDRLLGNLLPKHLDPWAHLKGEGAKKKGAKGDAAAQDQAEGGSTQDQDQAKAAAKGPAFPSYFHVLELFTCTLAHICELRHGWGWGGLQHQGASCSKLPPPGD
jgi:hypothetical protein